MDALKIALDLLPQELRCAGGELGPADEEIRLRAGQRPTVLSCGAEREISPRPVTAEDIEKVLQRATRFSLHAYSDQLREGYVNCMGGVRLGFCADFGDGGAMPRDFSSACIRIPHAIPTAGGELCRRLALSGESVLVLSAPGGGKTTLLRSMIRHASNSGIRVGVADERGELAAPYRGENQLDVGRRTDVVCGMGKAEAAMLLLRVMNVGLIAMDEISSPRDIDAVERIAGCGVTLLASAHASGVEELRRRPLYRRILELGVFSAAVVISGAGAERRYREARL